MARDGTQIAARVPPDVRAWLEERAARNCRSLNQEVIFIVRQEMQRASAPASENK